MCSDQNYLGWNICSLLSSKPGRRKEEWILLVAAAGLNDPHTEPIDSRHSSCESQGSSNWDFVFVPDRGRNSGAVTSRLLEPRHMPGMSPAHSEPHAGSRQCSSAHSEVGRQRRVRCVAVWVCVLHPHPHLLQGPQRAQRGCTWCRSIVFIQ